VSLKTNDEGALRAATRVEAAPEEADEPA
jgi:hypothetical protein